MTIRYTKKIDKNVGRIGEVTISQSYLRCVLRKERHLQHPNKAYIQIHSKLVIPYYLCASGMTIGCPMYYNIVLFYNLYIRLHRDYHMSGVYFVRGDRNDRITTSNVQPSLLGNPVFRSISNSFKFELKYFYVCHT